MIRRYIPLYHGNPDNARLAKITSCSDKPIYVFCHIYAANSYVDIVSELFVAVKNSGLGEKADKIFVTLIGNDIQKDIILQCASSSNLNIEIAYQSQNPTDYEFPALELMSRMAKESDFNALYFHSKGTGHCPEAISSYWPYYTSYNQLLKATKRVRRLMTYWNIDCFRSAIAALDEGFDCYGANYTVYPHCRYYAGNFWWTKSSYIRTLAAFSSEDKTNRYNAETWLLSNPKAKAYSACYTPISVGAIGVPHCIYAKHTNLLLRSLRQFSLILSFSKYTICKYLRIRRKNTL